VTWGRKPKFSVNGSRSCAELAIVHHLRAGGLGRGLGQCLPRRVAHAVVPRPGCPAARRGRRARVGRGDLRVPACRERRDAERLLRRVRLAGARPGRLFRGQGRAGPDQANSAQVRGERTALPPARGFHDRRGRRALPAPDAGPPTRDYCGPGSRTAAGGRRAAFRRPGPAASAPPACPGRAWS
jgi:hypothetical protein